MEFLICYSDRFHAKRAGLPLAGTSVEINSIDDLMAFSDKMQAKIIITRPDFEPNFISYMDIQDIEDAVEEHHLHQLPDAWRIMRWIEVYNGYRE